MIFHEKHNVNNEMRYFYSSLLFTSLVKLEHTINHVEKIYYMKIPFMDYDGNDDQTVIVNRSKNFNTGGSKETENRTS